MIKLALFPNNIENIIISSIIKQMIRQESNQKKLIKNVSPYQIINLMNKNQTNRQRILKQLEQLGIDTTQFQNVSLKDLLLKVDDIMKNTYSIKYLGLNHNQMGIISRRINPLQQTGFKISQHSEQLYSVHKYFYPKPLKVGKRTHQDSKININNLESEIKKQFEQNKLSHNKNKKMDKNTANQILRKTKLSGSWVNNAISDHIHKIDKQNSLGSKELGKQINEKVSATKSYSRFLTKGILIIKD